MFRGRANPERSIAFCDGVFAVLITVLVLDLRPPRLPSYAALLALWPTWISYAVSYLFIAIVWANHHHLMRYATEVTPRLIWFNFAHLFSVSLLPLATAWMATSELAPEPVSFYAAVFFLVNATYILLGLGLCCCCLIGYLRPEAPGSAQGRDAQHRTGVQPLRVRRDVCESLRPSWTRVTRADGIATQ
jgi:hypothetical protein